MKTTIRKIPKKGRGVFAQDQIKKGEIIESCHLILMDMEEVSETLEGYVYEYSAAKAAVALGNGSLLNHSDEANSEFYFDYRKKMLMIEAKRDIHPGEEITINYRYTSQDRERFNIYA